ncbi:N-terminal domain of peptidoglycan hydrolase CwlO-containing protein [Bacillus sp. OV322]|nr:C40 family peptidase [Bacillus sp. OV322]SFC00217.1 N-terminal domain of peptidoglycan hydrolase CwlO-containing protein [Bacillus sp. OV322]
MKKRLIAINTTIVLGLGSVFSIPAVHASSIHELQGQKAQISGKRSQVQTNISAAVKKITSLQESQTKLNAQIKRIDQAIADNNTKIEETKEKIAQTQIEVDGLRSDITKLNERIAKRNDVLKQRALSFQESGGDVDYLSVILGSSSFRDFVDRVGAVATIVEADQDILKQHEADKKELKEKEAAVEKKLAELTSTKVEFEGMIAQIQDQKKESLILKADLKKKEAETQALKKGLEKTDSKLAAQEFSIQKQMEQERKRQAELEAARLRAAAEAQARKKEMEKRMSEQNRSQAQSSPTPSPSQSQSQSVPASDDSPARSSADSVHVISGGGNPVTAGYRYIGNSVYVFGGGRSDSDIANGRFDCSSFVHWAYEQAGISLGARGSVSTDTLKNMGSQVSSSDMQPGDLVFFNTYKTDGHVGIYVGNGKFIGAQSSTGVAVADMTSGYWKQKFNGRVVRIR